MATLGTIIQSAFDPSGASKKQKGYVDNVVSPNNEAFKKASEQYGKYIDSNTGKTAYNDAMNAGKSDGSQMYNDALGNAKKETAGMADRITQKQASGAASQALGNAVSSGMTRGRAAMDAGQTAANAYSNAYAQNYNTQLGQQNQLMGANLGQMNNQQNMYNQQLANQLNAQGTQMGAQLTNDQSQYNQQMNNLKEGKKEATGPLGWIADAFSDENMKDKVEVGKSEDLKDKGYPNSTEGMRSKPKLKPARPIGVTTGNNRKAKNLNVKKPYGKELTKAQNLSISNPYFLQEDEETNVSDMNLKDSLQVGLSDEDPRMTHYKLCGEKLKQMNPNKWKELKWEAK